MIISILLIPNFDHLRWLLHSKGVWYGLDSRLLLFPVMNWLLEAEAQHRRSAYASIDVVMIRFSLNRYRSNPTNNIGNTPHIGKIGIPMPDEIQLQYWFVNEELFTNPQVIQKWIQIFQGYQMCRWTISENLVKSARRIITLNQPNMTFTRSPDLNKQNDRHQQMIMRDIPKCGRADFVDSHSQNRRHPILSQWRCSGVINSRWLCSANRQQ